MIEILVVTAVIGVLAAIAIPSYHGYTVRAKVSECLNLAAPARIAVSEGRLSGGSDIGAFSATGYCADIQLGEGDVIVMTTRNTGAAVDPVLQLVPRTPGGGNGSSTDWDCEIVSGRPGHVPASCRAAGTAVAIVHGDAGGGSGSSGTGQPGPTPGSGGGNGGGGGGGTQAGTGGQPATPGGSDPGHSWADDASGTPGDGSGDPGDQASGTAGADGSGPSGGSAGTGGDQGASPGSAPGDTGSAGGSGDGSSGGQGSGGQDAGAGSSGEGSGQGSGHGAGQGGGGQGAGPDGGLGAGDEDEPDEAGECPYRLPNGRPHPARCADWPD